MNLIIFLVSTMAVVILLLAFVNFRLAVSLYVAYQILVPFLDIKIGGVPLSYNLVNLILLIVFLFLFRQKKIPIDFSVIKPFLIFMGLFLIFIPFQDDTPLGFQFQAWRSNLMLGAILPLIIWNMVLYDQKFLKYLGFTLMISILISGLYGLFLTQMNGVNPYMISILPMEGKEYELDAYVDSAKIRAISYVQSTFGHPMAFGVFLLSAVIYVIYMMKKSDSKIYWVLTGVVILNILFAGVRSTILAAFLGLVYYLINIRKIKLTLSIMVLFVIFLAIVSTNETLSKYFAISSLSESNTNSIVGSSVEGRIEQFMGVFKEIQNSPIIGKGYSWNGYYLVTYGNHPIMVAFESLLMVIILNNGLIGILIWAYFIIATFKLNKKLIRQKSSYLLLNTSLVLYIAYTMFTGDYGYMKFYMMFYAIVLATMVKLQNYEFKKSKSNRNLFTTIPPAGGK